MTLVNEVMTPAVVKLREDDTLGEATTLMSQRKVAGAPVVDKDDNLVGMLSERDILEYAASKEGVGLEVRTLSFVTLPYDRIVRDEELCRRYKRVGETKVADAMNEEVVTVDVDDTVEGALETMLRLGFNRLPVVSNRKLVGIIARQNVLVAMCRELGEGRPRVCETMAR